MVDKRLDLSVRTERNDKLIERPPSSLDTPLAWRGNRRQESLQVRGEAVLTMADRHPTPVPTMASNTLNIASKIEMKEVGKPAIIRRDSISRPPVRPSGLARDTTASFVEKDIVMAETERITTVRKEQAIVPTPNPLQETPGSSRKRLLLDEPLVFFGSKVPVIEDQIATFKKQRQDPSMRQEVGAIEVKKKRQDTPMPKGIPRGTPRTIIIRKILSKPSKRKFSIQEPDMNELKPEEGWITPSSRKLGKRAKVEGWNGEADEVVYYFIDFLPG